MIKKLTYDDNNLVMDYLVHEKEFNLFIIGDIENYGYENDFQEIWGQFDEKNNLKSITLRYYESIIFYAKGDYDIEEIIELIHNTEFKVLSGKKDVVDKFKNYFDFDNSRDLYFCKLDNDEKLKSYDDKNEVKKIQLENVDDIINLVKHIDEFKNLNPESTRRKFEDGSGRGYCIYDNDKLVSMAQSTAENKHSAMIVGVATHPNYRKCGFASSCMVSLCSELLNEDKSLCLFYDNPKAGKIYKGIGFEDIGIWTMHSK